MSTKDPETDWRQRSIWRESEAYLQQMVVRASRQPALSNNCISQHPSTNWASREGSPTDVCHVHNRPPRAQNRWVEPKLNLLMLHWTSIMAGSCRGEFGLEQYKFSRYINLFLISLTVLSSKGVILQVSKLSVEFEGCFSVETNPPRSTPYCSGLRSDGYLCCGLRWPSSCFNSKMGCTAFSHPATLSTGNSTRPIPIS